MNLRGSPYASSGAPRLLLFGMLVLGGFIALHWSVIFALQSVARFEEAGGVVERHIGSSVITPPPQQPQQQKRQPHLTPTHSKERLLPQGGGSVVAADGARPFSPPGFGRFKLAGDPALCKYRKWKWCYIKGNVETFRRVFGVQNPLISLRETPSLPMDLEGGGPWQLLW